MKAAFKTGRERFEIRDIDPPQIGPNDCLIRVHYCATCVWCYKEWLRDGTDDIYGPGATGHEMSGVVERVGADVTKWRVGDEVLTYFSGHCEVCPECRAGRTTYCANPDRPRNVAGGYAQYVAAAEQCLLPSPKGIDLKHAALITDMVGTSMHAIRRAFSVNLSRDVVAVWGLGPVGLFTVQGLRCFEGVRCVIALDPIRSRREVAMRLGADIILDPLEKGTQERLRAQNDGRGANYAFNCALASAEMPYNTLGPDGYLMNITGGFTTQSQCEKRVDGSFYFFKKEFEENVCFVLGGRIRLEPVLTHEFPLSEINEAMELRAKHPAESLKVVIGCF